MNHKATPTILVASLFLLCMLFIEVKAAVTECPETSVFDFNASIECYFEDYCGSSYWDIHNFGIWIDSLVEGVPEGFVEYLWLPNESNASELIITEPGVYTFVGTTVEGCQQNHTITVVEQTIEADFEMVCGQNDYCGTEYWDRGAIDLFLNNLSNGQAFADGTYTVNLKNVVFGSAASSFNLTINGETYQAPPDGLEIEFQWTPSVEIPIATFSVYEFCSDIVFGYDLFFELLITDSLGNQYFEVMPIVFNDFPVCSNGPLSEILYSSPESVIVCDGTVENLEEFCLGFYCPLLGWTTEIRYVVFEGECPESFQGNLETFIYCGEGIEEPLPENFRTASYSLDDLDLEGLESIENLNLGIYSNNSEQYNCDLTAVTINIPLETFHLSSAQSGLENTTYLIIEAPTEINAPDQFESYLWMPGEETTQSITVSEPGTYAVLATLDNDIDCQQEFVFIIEQAPILTEYEIVCNMQDYCGNAYWDKGPIDLFLNNVTDAEPFEDGSFLITIENIVLNYEGQPFDGPPNNSYLTVNGETYQAPINGLQFEFSSVPSNENPIASFGINEFCTLDFLSGFDIFLAISITDSQGNQSMDTIQIIDDDTPSCTDLAGPFNELLSDIPNQVNVCEGVVVNTEDFCTELYCSFALGYMFVVFEGDCPENFQSTPDNEVLCSPNQDSGSNVPENFITAASSIEDLNLTGFENMDNLNLGIYSNTYFNPTCELTGLVLNIPIESFLLSSVESGLEDSTYLIINSPTEINAPDQFESYLWMPGGETAQSITVSDPGTYTLLASLNSNVDCPQEFVFVVEQETAINEISFNESTGIYPNPADAYFLLDNKRDNVKEIIVYNQLGEIFKIINPSQQRIDSSNWPCGQYFIQFVFEEDSLSQNKSRKLLIVH